MPLTPHDGSVVEEVRWGLSFVMWNGTQEVVVRVDKGALTTMRSSTPGDDRAIFDRHRAALETIASANYDDGIIEPDGSTVIRSEDVLKLE